MGEHLTTKRKHKLSEDLFSTLVESRLCNANIILETNSGLMANILINTFLPDYHQHYRDAVLMCSCQFSPTRQPGLAKTFSSLLNNFFYQVYLVCLNLKKLFSYFSRTNMKPYRCIYNSEIAYTTKLSDLYIYCMIVQCHAYRKHRVSQILPMFLAAYDVDNIRGGV